MRVFQINTVYGSGSTGHIVADLKHIMEDAGEECFVAFGRGRSEECYTSCVSNKADLYWHALFTRITDRTGLYSVHATKRMIGLIKKMRPDIIHLHNIHGYYLNIKMLFHFFKEYGRPVIWTFHDCWPFTGHCAYFEKYGKYELCNKWKKQCEKCDRISEYPKSLTDGSRKNYIHKKEVFTEYGNISIVTVSDWLKQRVNESFLAKFPVYTIYNGVDLNVFKQCDSEKLRIKYNLEKKKVVLGVANIWSGLKGLTDFIQLAGVLDNTEYQIVLLGVDEKVQKNIPYQILALPRTECVEELVEWYNTAEVHFNASRAETFGMTVIESLACGTPVVSYNICAMKEILDASCGYLVDKIGDVKEAARFIRKCNKPEMKPSCIARSVAFEKNMQYRKYMALYKMILEKSRG